MNMNDYNILNKFFSRSTISNLVLNNDTKLYNYCVNKFINKELTGVSNMELIKGLYCILKKKYRNEYFYKNTVLNKLLLGKHSLNTTVALSELSIAKSKADFLLINGKAVVYEIKSDIDSLERVSSQIEDYFKAFKLVYIVTNQINIEKLQDLINNDYVGLIELTKRNQLSTKRIAKPYNEMLEYENMFKVLRKTEYENIIIRNFNKLPEVPQVKHFKECFNLIQLMDKEAFYREMIIELKKRNITHSVVYKEFVPYELRYLLYFEDYNLESYKKMKDFLEKGYEG